MTLDEINDLIAKTNLGLVDIQASFRDRFEFMQPSEQYALKKVDRLLIDIMAFSYSKLRSIPAGVNDFMTGQRIRLAGAEPILDLINLDFNFNEDTNSQLHHQTMSIFDASVNIEINENILDILRYLQKVLCLFKANLILSEYQYFISLNHTPNAASEKASYVSNGATSKSWLDVFNVTIDSTINELGFNSKEKRSYKDCRRTLLKLQQLLTRFNNQIRANEKSLTPSRKRKPDDGNGNSEHLNTELKKARRVLFRK